MINDPVSYTLGISYDDLNQGQTNCQKKENGLDCVMLSGRPCFKQRSGIADQVYADPSIGKIPSFSRVPDHVDNSGLTCIGSQNSHVACCYNYAALCVRKFIDKYMDASFPDCGIPHKNSMNRYMRSEPSKDVVVQYILDNECVQLVDGIVKLFQFNALIDGAICKLIKHYGEHRNLNQSVSHSNVVLSEYENTANHTAKIVWNVFPLHYCYFIAIDRLDQLPNTVADCLATEIVNDSIYFDMFAEEFNLTIRQQLMEFVGRCWPSAPRQNGVQEKILIVFETTHVLISGECHGSRVTVYVDKTFKNLVYDNQKTIMEKVRSKFYEPALKLCQEYYPKFMEDIDKHVRESFQDAERQVDSRFAGKDLHNFASSIIDLFKDEVVVCDKQMWEELIRQCFYNEIAIYEDEFFNNVASSLSVQ